MDPGAGAGAEQGAGLAADDPGWDHMSSALWGIVLGTISFLTIVGNIMVSSDNSWTILCVEISIKYFYSISAKPEFYGGSCRYI